MSKTLERLARRERATRRHTGGRSAFTQTPGTPKHGHPSTGPLGASPAIRLREAIEAARDWGELEEIVQEVEQTFQAGFLTQSAAEGLALLVVGRSRKVEVQTDGERRE